MKTLRELVTFMESESDLEALRNFQNKESVLAWLKSRNLKLLGSGEYRSVYDLGNGTVLKLAKDDGGKTANSIELTTSQCLGDKHAMKVIEMHPDALWSIAEKLMNVSENEVESRLLELLSPELQNRPIAWFPDMVRANAKQLEKHHGGKFKMGDLHDSLFGKNMWYTGLIQGIVRCGLSPNDLGFRNWGIRTGSNELVLLDLGGDGY